MAIKDRRYSKVSYDQIISDFETILASKQGSLADIGESSYGKTIIELFAANSDMQAAWIEEAYKESFLESATTTEAIYLGARSLGYSIRRPVPAKAGIGVSLKRTGIYPNVKVNIPKGAEFQGNGRTLTAIDDMEFVFDRNDPDTETGLMTLSAGRAVLAEGTVKTVSFFSDASQNQEFIILDPTFSDWFGTGDPNYVEPDRMLERSSRFTSVMSDASLVDNPDTIPGLEDVIFWRVSRRGFSDPALSADDINDIDDYVSNSLSNNSINYTALLSTSNDGRVKVEFSDGVLGAIPFGNIVVKYFSTTGELGNALNVSGNDIKANSTNIIITQVDGKESDLTLADLNFALTTDIRGGLNIESLDSVKKNAPKVYNSLDSLNNQNSYRTFLSRYSDVRYANAFGESVLNKVKGKGRFDLRYSNLVRFTLLKDLYRERDGKYFVTSPFEYYVEGYKVNGLTYVWDYDYNDLPDEADLGRINFQIEKIKERLANENVSMTRTRRNNNGELVTETITDPAQMVKDYVVDFDLDTPIAPKTIFNVGLEPKDFIETGSELETIIDSLNRRGYLTLGGGQHAYVPPVVHEMAMDITVVLFEGSNFNEVKTTILNTIYEYLKEYTEFAKPIFRSKVESLVQALPEVAGLNLYFKPKVNEYSGLELDKLEWLATPTSAIINQTGITLDGFETTLTYDYKEGTALEATDQTVTFEVGNQETIANTIKTYYTSNIAYLDTTTGKYVPKSDLTEEDINKFTGFVWWVAMNEVYLSLFDIYKEYKANGQPVEADKVYNTIESLKGWYFNSGKLFFKDTAIISNMSEGTENTLANYKIYALEYVKLIRNILADVVSVRLIDEHGNVSNYTNQNEVVQFNISNSDIKVTIGT